MTPFQRTVLAAGLPDRSPTASRSAAIDVDEFHLLVAWAVTERLTGLLCHAVAHGAIVAEPHDLVEFEAVAGDAHRSAIRHTLAAEATAVEVVQILADHGIEALAFKGAAAAHLDYPDPSMRVFLDTDLHVPRERFGEAINVLLGAGHSRATAPLGERWERRFARACELQSPHRLEVDLHAAVATGYFGMILDHGALRADPVAITLAGHTVEAFPLPARALISSYGIVLSRGPGLRLRRDLVQQLLELSSDWPMVVDLAGPDGAVVVARALATVVDTFGPGLVSPDAVAWAGTVTATPTGRRALELAGRALDDGWSADARSTMLALGPLDSAEFLAGIAAGRLRRLRAPRARSVS